MKRGAYLRRPPATPRHRDRFVAVAPRDDGGTTSSIWARRCR